MRARKSRIGVYPVNGYWAFRVEAPSEGRSVTVMQACFETEAAARSAAEYQARFYDKLERWWLRGAHERRMKRPFERGERICEKCGEPHNGYYVLRAGLKFPTWAHPVDGHDYRAESWETLARRLLAEKVAA